jgi:hypothetical protein
MRWLRPIPSVALLAAVLGVSVTSYAQMSSFVGVTASPNIGLDAVTPRLSPDRALSTYERDLKAQSAELVGYTATTVIDAELPGSSQKAEFELKRHYAAPSVLEFTPVRSSGDKFVKSNVIVRLLQSEVDHVHRREQSETAITSANYKFNYKGLSQIDGIVVHMYEVKPRQKRVGLFKGRVFVDAASGRLLRAQGTIVKSPSFFIKKIDFVQDYATIDGFTFPTHIHSESDTRLVGKAVVDITHRDYQPEFADGTGRDTLAQSVTLLDGTN